jgi:hypothetical protein
MAKVMKTIYVEEHEAEVVDQNLHTLKAAIPSLDYDVDWDKVPVNEDDRCEWCVEHNVENCRHIGMSDTYLNS